ncbi:MAG: urea transporter [bacterium]
MRRVKGLSNYLMVDAFIKSYSQIFFSESRLLGLFVLITTFINPSSGINALVGGLCSNISATLLGYNRQEIKAGLYGFNGILLGMALSLYSGIGSIHLFFLILLFSILTTLGTAALSGFLRPYSLPAMSMPFVVLTWVVILTSPETTRGISVVYPLNIWEIGHIFKTFLKNIGLIVFSPNEISGLLILTGLFFYSRVLVVITSLSFLASLIFTASFLHPPVFYLFLEDNGFNAILTAIALSAVFFVPNLKSLSLGIIGAIFSIIIGTALSQILYLHKIPVLSAPFNLVTLLVLYAIQQSEAVKGLYRIFISESPEKNYKKFIKERENYGRIDRGLILPFMGWWFVSQGNNGRHTHKDVYRFALDFIVTDEQGQAYKDKDNDLSDYYCYNVPVVSPADGIVIDVESSVHDNPVGGTNLEHNFGNYVIIQHAPSLFSILCHLKQGQVNVSSGQTVKRGQIIGNLGSSGCAPYPHLHIQFQSSGILKSPTISVCFSDFLIKDGDFIKYIPLDIPKEKQNVMNILVDNRVKDSIGFEIGQQDKYEITLNGKTFQDVLTYDMDSNGLMFVKSAYENERLYFSKGERSLSFYPHSGNKMGLLSILSMGIDKIPFYANERLLWQKAIPSFELIGGMRDFLLPYLRCSYLIAEHSFIPSGAGDTFILLSKVSNKKGCLAERSIIFNRGILELTFRAKNINCRMKRGLYAKQNAKRMIQDNGF